jgi:hypothetical protein
MRPSMAHTCHEAAKKAAVVSSWHDVDPLAGVRGSSSFMISVTALCGRYGLSATTSDHFHKLMIPRGRKDSSLEPELIMVVALAPLRLSPGLTRTRWPGDQSPIATTVKAGPRRRLPR